jgi:predicted dehydrogenase
MKSNGSNGSRTNGEPLRFALIGCGRISQVHFHVLQKEVRVNLVAVADTDGQAAGSAAEANGAKAFTDPIEMMETMKPQAVVVCTPPNTHRPIVDAALASGAHVLCEKPLAIAIEDAEEMESAAEEADRVLMMASKFRYVPDIIKARGVIRSGILGNVVLLENEFCSRVDMKKRWNAEPEVAGGGVLIDNGSHSVDIFRYLTGPIDEIKAVFGKRSQDIQVEDTARLLVRSEDGTLGSIDLSWSIHKENPFFIHVYGTAGTLEVGWKGSRYRQSEKQEWVNFGNGYDKFLAVGAQLANFIDTITGKGQPLITVEDAIESVRVIQCAYRAVEEDRWDRVTA